jgi:hypothetical protein
MKQPIAFCIALGSFLLLTCPHSHAADAANPACALSPPALGGSENVTGRFGISGQSTVVKRLTTITGTGKSGAMLTYYDVTGYLPILNNPRLIFNVHTKANGKAYNQMVSTDPDGGQVRTHACWISPTTPTSYGFVSDDGKFMVYMGETEKVDEFAVYGVWLDGPADDANKNTYRISQLAYSCTPSADGKTQCQERPTLSPPVYDTNLKKYIINYNVGSKLYSLAYPSSANLSDLGRGAYKANWKTGLVPLDAPDSADVNLGFHRVRTNPKYPNLVMYRRAKVDSFDSRAGFEVVDLKNPQVHLLVANKLNGGFHPIWHPSGLKVGVNKGELDETDVRRFTEYPIVPPSAQNQGTLSAGAPIMYRNAPADVFYISYSRDPAKPYIAFATGLEDTSADGSRKGKLYVMKNTLTANPLAIGYSNFFSEGENGVDGQPRLSFFNGVNGLVFSSDNGSNNLPPQVYTVRNFPLPN